jgi:hypothetical protein
MINKSERQGEWFNARQGFSRHELSGDPRRYGTSFSMLSYVDQKHQDF